ncbi:MAG: hypothetical protein RTU92_06065 [Candidatus Thorarchaeota archaeon]
MSNESVDFPRESLIPSEKHQERVLFVNVLLKEKRRERERRKLLPPSVPEDGIVPVKSCRKCYYYSFLRRVGVDWYINCSHPSQEGKNRFLMAGINLPCWRPGLLK